MAFTFKFADSDLELETYNPYFGGRVVVDSSDNTAVLTREVVIWDGNVNDRFHTISAGDELDALAYDYYLGIVETPDRYWWLIADANADKIRNPLDLSGLINEEIVIPYFQLFKLIRNG